MSFIYSCGNDCRNGDIIERVKDHVSANQQVAGHVIGARGVAYGSQDVGYTVSLESNPNASCYLNLENWKLLSRATVLREGLTAHEVRSLELVGRIQTAEAAQRQARVALNDADAAVESARALLLAHAARLA